MHLIQMAVGAFVATYVLSRLMGHMALRPWRKSAGQHWTQRANLLFPARVTATLCLLILPVDIYLAMKWYCLQRPMSHTLGTGLIWLILFCAFAGSFLAQESFLRKIYPELNFGLFVRTVFANLLLRGGLILVLCVTILTMPSVFSLRTWLQAAGALAVLLAMQYGLSRQILVWLRLFKPADEHLQKLVADTAGCMRVTVSKVWISQSVLASAYALPVTKELIFTRELLRQLNDDQIAAVCAHELGHLTESRAVRLARQMNALLFYPLVFINPVTSLMHNDFLFPVIWVTLALGIKILMARLGRRMEVRADAIARAQQVQPAVYARALEQIYQVNQMPACMGRRKAVHPNLYDRMIAAGVTPDYAKPRPPRGNTVWGLILSAALGILVVLNLLQVDSPRVPDSIRQYRQWLRNHPDYRSAPDLRHGPSDGPIQNIPLAPAPDNGGTDRLQRILFFQLRACPALHYCWRPMKGNCL